MVATTRTRMLAVGHEFFSRQARFKSSLVQKLSVVHHFFPVVRWMDVDFNHAGVWCDLQHFEAWVSRRRIAFQNDLESKLNCSFFNCMQEV